MIEIAKETGIAKETENGSVREKGNGNETETETDDSIEQTGIEIGRENVKGIEIATEALIEIETVIETETEDLGGPCLLAVERENVIAEDGTKAVGR